MKWMSLSISRRLLVSAWAWQSWWPLGSMWITPCGAVVGEGVLVDVGVEVVVAKFDQVW